MSGLIGRIELLARGEEGQDLLEYALLIALIALVCVGAITLAGTNASAAFNAVANAISS